MYPQTSCRQRFFHLSELPVSVAVPRLYRVAVEQSPTVLVETADGSAAGGKFQDFACTKV